MTLDQKIEEAEDALHELSLGKRVVSISRNGKSLSFSQTNRVDLELYIARLKQQKPNARRGPMGISL